MRASIIKIGRGSVALACAGSSVPYIENRHRKIYKDHSILQCETSDSELERPPSTRWSNSTQPYLYCEAVRPTYSDAPIRWRPGFQFHLEYKAELERELGHGGQGQVFLAVHNSSGVSRAVKRVERRIEAADRALQRELEVMQRLRGCPHIVQVVEAFADEKYRYVVMELCYGLDLVDAIFEELATGGDEPMIVPSSHIPHIAAVFREMVQAVAECHKNKVYHMDIKPENFIHVSTESVGGVSVKLLDFGLAWMDVDKATVTDGTQLGCSKYLAPELFKSGVEISPEAVDMYALGVSLFNLFTGRFPYPFYRMGRPRSRPDLSLIPCPEARALLQNLLSADANQRARTDEVLKFPFIANHVDAVVRPLSELTPQKSVKNFFTEESPSALQGRGCACAVVSHCPHRAKARNVLEGEVLFNEGDQSRAIYFVSRGCFNVFKNGGCIGKVESDSVLGETGALFGQARQATVIAAEDSEVFEFKDFGEKLGSTQQRYALKGLQEIALKRLLANTTRDFLKRSPIFRDASDKLLDTIIAASDRAFFNQGDMVLEEDVEKHAMYIVQDGLLEVRRGNSSYIAFAGPGEIVGETALLYGQRSTCETLKALKPTTAVVLDRSEFALILSEFPNERDLIMQSAEWRFKEMGVAAAI